MFKSRWLIGLFPAAFFICFAAVYAKNSDAKATGNPYKGAIAEVMKQGAQIELCGATATAHHRVNSDLLPGVKVNTDAMISLTQLGKAGYVEITE